MSEEQKIVAVFTDGGLVGHNPSTKGGTWAWCAVTPEGEHVREVSAYLLPKTSTCPGNPRVGSDVVTNNDVEFFAAMRALESMAVGWSGALATDSRITIERLKKCREGQMPTAFRADWFSRAECAFKRLGTVNLIHLAGHPTQKDLERGYKENSDGTTTRVNRHQTWCDSRCRELAEQFEARVNNFFEYVKQGALV